MKNKLRTFAGIALVLASVMIFAQVVLRATEAERTDAALPTNTGITATAVPTNVILFIGDGMGPEQVRAAGMYRHGAAGTLAMESFPISTTIATHAADNAITDSAAAATAMATGHKVNNGVISVALPGDGSELETLLEFFHTHCKPVALVTTAYATHATPAAFGAHESSRSNTVGIAMDYLTQTQPEVLLGGGANGLTPLTAQTAGYAVAQTRAQMLALPQDGTRISGQFGTTHLPYEYDYFTGTDPDYDTLPHLTEMVTTTLLRLEGAPSGFFLMVEGGRIDHAGHDNNIARNVFETLEFDRAVQATYDWAATRSDTLIVVTADHETGGLTVTANNGAGSFPDVTWSSTGHTATPVSAYAWGVNASLLRQVTDNTHIYQMLTAGATATPGCAPNLARVTNVQAAPRRDTPVIVATVLLVAGLWMLSPSRPRPTTKSSQQPIANHESLITDN